MQVLWHAGFLWNVSLEPGLVWCDAVKEYANRNSSMVAQGAPLSAAILHVILFWRYQVKGQTSRAPGGKRCQQHDKLNHSQKNTYKLDYFPEIILSSSKFHRVGLESMVLKIMSPRLVMMDHLFVKFAVTKNEKAWIFTEYRIVYKYLINKSTIMTTSVAQWCALWALAVLLRSRVSFTERPIWEMMFSKFVLL